MKIVLVSTNDIHGGAAIACYRLLHALNRSGAYVKALVQTKKSNDTLVDTTTKSKFKKLFNFYRFVFERVYFLFFERSKAVRFAFTISNTGERINSNATIKWADIINIHWVYNGFLSILSLNKLLKLKKPIVWTLHDMWAFTGGCHYAGDCTNFKFQCGYCPFLKFPAKHDLSHRIYKKKLKKLFGHNQDKIVFVTCSDWLCNEAKASSLLQGFRIESIPNPVNIDLFKPNDKEAVRSKLGLNKDELYIVFAAMNINDKRKGFDYLLKSLDIIKNNYPELSKKLKLVVFGVLKDKTALDQLPFPVINMGLIKSQEKVAEIYNAVDLYIIPSLEENLPNGVVESMACGTPVVGFRTGGIPQMIDHMQTGYLSDYKSVDDLAKGIVWCLDESDKELLSKKSREKAVNYFSEEIVARKYSDLYTDVISKFRS